jgi:hypothetical protein
MTFVIVGDDEFSFWTPNTHPSPEAVAVILVIVGDEEP